MRGAELRIAVFDDWGRISEATGLRERLVGHGEVVVYTDHAERAQFTDRLADVDIAFLVRDRSRIGLDQAESLQRLQLVVQIGNSSEHVDLELLAAHDVEFVLPPFLFHDWHPTAEFVIASMLGLANRITLADRAMRRGDWPALTTRSLRGRRLGLVGYGRVARHIARLATAFEMEIVTWSRSLPPGGVVGHDVGARVQTLDMDEVLATSEFVVIQVRLGDGTRGLIGSRELALLRPDAFLINASRGAILDEGALIDVLERGAIAGAALDVFAVEPLADSPLAELDDVVLTPHIGWTEESATERLFEQAEELFEAWIETKPTGRER